MFLYHDSESVLSRFLLAFSDCAFNVIRVQHVTPLVLVLVFGGIAVARQVVQAAVLVAVVQKSSRVF